MDKATESAELRSRVGAAKRLRLLHAFHSFGCGGAQTRFVRLANYFGPALEHLVISMNGDCSSRDLIAENVDVAAHPLGPAPKTLWGRISRFNEVLNNVRPDCLVTHNWGTIEWAFAARRSGIRHIHIEDGFGPDEAERQKLRRILGRRLALGRSRVVVPSRTLERIARETWRIPAARLHYIPNGVDCLRYSRPWCWNEEPVIGTVAALRPEKNVSRLLRAFAIVNGEVRCRLTIVGDGPERAKLQALAVDLGVADRASFMGHVADPIPLYHSFNVFALSSDTEQMPYTVLEAMAVGLPVVSPDVGDVKLMVSPENAPLIVEPAEQALAGAALMVVRDGHYARRSAEANCRKAREQFEESRTAKAFARLYGHVASSA